MASSDCADGDCATYTRVMNSQVRAVLFASGEVTKALMFKPLKGQCCHTDRCNKPLGCSAGMSSKPISLQQLSRAIFRVILDSGLGSHSFYTAFPLPTSDPYYRILIVCLVERLVSRMGPRADPYSYIRMIQNEAEGGGQKFLG